MVRNVVSAYEEGISSRQLGLLVSNPAVYDDYKTMEPLAPCRRGRSRAVTTQRVYGPCAGSG